LDLAGSDTLEDLAIALINTGTCGAGLNYVDGGSGRGETALINNTQQVAPMSRQVNTTTSAACNGTGEGMFMAMDAISVVADSEQTESCGGTHARRGGFVFSAPNTVPVVATTPSGPPVGPFPDFGADWATKLRTLFSGDGSGSAASCNAGNRITLANDYKALFAGGCAGAGQANTCTQVKHLYRRGDASGTTDLFKSLVGTAAGGAAIAQFCNGNDQQDNDPIRRPCTSEDQVCDADNALGLVLPVLPPEVGTQQELYNQSKCQDGKFGFRPAPLLDPTCCLRAPVSNTCLRVSTLTQCQTPLTAANTPCLNGNQTPNVDAFPNLPIGWPKVNGQNMNPGVFNLFVRDDNTQGRIRFFRSGSVEVSRAFYRINSTTGGRNHAGTASSASLCRIINATEEIGCLVQRPNSGCSLGFAGYAAVDGPTQAFAEPVALNNIDISQQSVQNLALAAVGQPTVGPTYPLSRKLYLNTFKGFENVTGAELTFAQCFANVTTGQLSTAGFFPVPALPGNVGSAPVCESMCPQANGVNGGHCAGNPAPFN
jgi:ABC-type phosphate transport system substrate-binding protein